MKQLINHSDDVAKVRNDNSENLIFQNSQISENDDKIYCDNSFLFHQPTEKSDLLHQIAHVIGNANLITVPRCSQPINDFENNDLLLKDIKID